MTGFICLRCVQAREASAALPAAKAAAAKAAAAVAPLAAPAPTPAQAHDTSLQVDFEPEEHEEASPQPRQSRPAQPLPKSAQVADAQRKPKVKVRIDSLLHELLGCNRSYLALEGPAVCHCVLRLEAAHTSIMMHYRRDALHHVQHAEVQHVTCQLRQHLTA